MIGVRGWMAVLIVASVANLLAGCGFAYEVAKCEFNRANCNIH